MAILTEHRFRCYVVRTMTDIARKTEEIIKDFGREFHSSAESFESRLDRLEVLKKSVLLRPTLIAERRGGERRRWLKVPGVEKALPYGLEVGCLHEFYSAQKGGSTSVVMYWLGALTRLGKWVYWGETSGELDISSLNGFEVDTSHFIWVRGLGIKGKIESCFKAVEIAVLSNRFEVVVLDLLGQRKGYIKDAWWFRLMRQIEKSMVSLWVLVETPMIPCAAYRFRCSTVEWPKKKIECVVERSQEECLSKKFLLDCSHS